MNYTEVLEQLKEWACNLLIMQYRQAPKNRDFISIISDIIFSNNIIFQIRDGFNLGRIQFDLSGCQSNIEGNYIKSAIANFEDFSNNSQVNNESGSYIFKYKNSSWTLKNNAISLADFGIKINGTPIENDVIIANYTAHTALKTQLDIIGKWVGIDRYYNGIDLWEQPYTALVNYSNVSDNTYEDWQGGFSSFDANSPYFIGNNDGGFLTYDQYRNTRISVNEMGDDYFRQLIKLKIIKNSIAFTNKNIDDAIWEWSGGLIYTTWGTMEVTYHYPLSMTNIMQLAIYKDVLLAPTGCTIKTEVY